MDRGALRLGPSRACVVFAWAVLTLPITLGACEATPPSGSEAGERHPSCASETLRWIDEAAAATGVRVSAVACYGNLARLRLEPDGAPPLDVEIAESPGPAFTRAGPLRVSPIVEVADYGTLAAPQRDAFERLLVWLRADPARVSLAAGAPQIDRVVPRWAIDWVGGWLLGLAFALLAGASACAPHVLPRRADRRVLAAVVTVALALRLGLGLWGPLHINGQGPLWILGAAIDPAQLAVYGPGYPEIFATITSLAGRSPDLAVFATNALLSALVPALAFALGRLAGIDRTRAAIAAGLLAIDPIAVRTSASESYFVPIIALTLGASVAIAAAVRSAERSRVAAAFWLVAAALLATQAARIHPIAWIGVGLAPAAAMLGGGARATRPSADAAGSTLSARLRLAALAVLAISVALAVTSAGWIASGLADAARYRGGAFVDVRVPLALLLAAVVVTLVRPRWWTLWLVALAHLGADASLRGIYGQSELWQASFDRLFVAVPALAVVAIVPTAWLVRRTTKLVGAAVLLGGAALATARLVQAPTTEQLEYRWLRDELARLPAGCRATGIGRADKRVLYVPWYVLEPGPGPGGAGSRWLDARSAKDVLAATAGSSCVVWIHGSLCESPQGSAACAAIERELPLREIAALELHAVPSNDELPYERARVRVAIHRVDP